MTCLSATTRPGKPNLSGSCDTRTGPTGTQQPSVLDEAGGCSLSSTMTGADRAAIRGTLACLLIWRGGRGGLLSVVRSLGFRPGLPPGMPARDDEHRADERERQLGQG